MSNATAAKIPAVSIAITRAEGPARLCRTRTFKTWKNASAALLRAAHTYPAGGAYDKHDLVVTFADGETYKGRLDCKADGEDCDVAAHVREYVEFLAGARRPAHMTPEQYSERLRSDPASVGEALAFLATYHARGAAGMGPGHQQAPGPPRSHKHGACGAQGA